MGFLGRITGFDTHKDAMNAILANNLIEKADKGLRAKITDEVIRIHFRVMGTQAGTEDDVLNRVNGYCRLVQMQFVTMACMNLGIRPIPARLEFNLVTKPFLADGFVTAGHLSAAITTVKKFSGMTVTWPGNDARIDFREFEGRARRPSPAAQNGGSNVGYTDVSEEADTEPFALSLPDITQLDASRAFASKAYTAFLVKDVRPLGCRAGIDPIICYPYVVAVFCNSQRIPKYYVTYEASKSGTRCLGLFDDRGGYHKNLGLPAGIGNEDVFLHEAMKVIQKLCDERFDELSLYRGSAA